MLRGIMNAKKILCFGDSNTWGFVPISSPFELRKRHLKEERWPGVLSLELSADFEVIEEGLSGRTTCFEDPIQGAYKSGLYYLLPCLESHRPLDLVIIMLGTNDLKSKYSAAPFDICQGIERLVKTIKDCDCGSPRILVVAPPILGNLTFWAESFDYDNGMERSAKLPQLYKEMTEVHGIDFFDANEVIHTDGIDGLHLSTQMHKRLGLALAERIKQLLI